MTNKIPSSAGYVSVSDQFRGCLLGGAVGDALGAPVEFMSRAEIFRTFGAKGIQEYVPAFGKLGAITDDTQMTLFTAEGLLRAWSHGVPSSQLETQSFIALAYQRWLHTQGEHHPLHQHCLDGGLLENRGLFSRRAPGITCLAGLTSMHVATDLATNNSKGCGGVMRVAPIGMFHAMLAKGNTADRSELLTQAFDLACRAAAITHGHPTGQLASGVFAAIIMQLLLETSLPDAIERVSLLLAQQPQHEETMAAVQTACRLAEVSPNDGQALMQLGGGWIAEEALAIALYCALSVTDFRSGVELAVNHSGDSDSTGSMAGQLLGVMHGASAIPTSWLMSLELRAVIETMAHDLATFPAWGSEGVAAPENRIARVKGESVNADDATNEDTEELFDPLDWIEIPVFSDEDLERHAETARSMAAWEVTFRAAAKADDCKVLQSHLRHLELPDEPGLLLDGTILLVQMSVAYLTMDSQEVTQFLSQQVYDPTQISSAPYLVTFDLNGKAYARVNVPASLRPLDLADLYDTPWHAYETVGFNDFWISRIDGNALSAQENGDFEKAVESDLRFDYCEDEVTFWFDPDTHDGILKVTVQDVYHDLDVDLHTINLYT